MTCNALTNFNPLIVSAEAQKLSACYEISFALERMYKNILLINRGLNAKTIDVTDTTLFQVASEQYQDTSLWTYLAEVNQMDDFMIETPRKLLVPPKPTSNMGFGT